MHYNIKGKVKQFQLAAEHHLTQTCQTIPLQPILMSRLFKSRHSYKNEHFSRKKRCTWFTVYVLVLCYFSLLYPPLLAWASYCIGPPFRICLNCLLQTQIGLPSLKREHIVLCIVCTVQYMYFIHPSIDGQRVESKQCHFMFSQSLSHLAQLSVGSSQPGNFSIDLRAKYVLRCISPKKEFML